MVPAKPNGRKRHAEAAHQALIAARKEKKAQTAQHGHTDDSGDDEDTKFTAKSPIAPPPKEKPTDAVDVPRDSDSDIEQPLRGKTIKQKRDRDTFEADTSTTQEPAKKKYTSKKERSNRAETLDRANQNRGGAGDNFDPSIAQMDPSLLADHFAKAIKRFYKSETELQLEKRYLPSSTFSDTTSYTAKRKKSIFGRFLEGVLPGSTHDLDQRTKEKASPHTLFICPSGLRAADLARELRTYHSTGNEVAKLFAKHFKIEQQSVYLRKASVGFGVGTPDRVKKLIDSGALKTGRLERIVIDGSYLDEKSRGFWNMADLFMPMLDLLKMKEVQKKLETRDMKVIVF